MRKSGCASKAGFLAFLLAGAGAVFLPAPAAARADAGPAIISSVQVRVDGEPAGPDLVNLVTIVPGESYSVMAADAAAKRLFQSGLFSDIQVLKEGEADVRLTFLLTRKLRVRKIMVSAEKGIAAKKLKDELYALRPDGEYSADRVRRAIAELDAALKKDGLYRASIEPRSLRVKGSPLMDVEFAIASGTRYTVAGLEISGEPGLPAADLKKRMETRSGRTYVPSVLEADIGRLKEYYGGAGYPRAEIVLEREAFDDRASTVALAVHVAPQERFRFVIRGAKVPEDIIRPIWEERIFEDWGLAQSEARVLTYLRGQGYIFATAKSSIERVAGEIRIVHEVNRGRAYKIYDALFEGLHYFTPDALKRELGFERATSLFGGLDGAKLFEMPGQIARVYETAGFLSTRVDLSFRQIGPDMTAIFTVDEGPQQTVARLTIAGAALFDDATLKGQIASKAGGPFYQPNIRKDIDRLESFYLNQGVRGTGVTAAASPAGERLFDVDFTVAEGRRVKIVRIVVTGGAVTRRGTIDRELKVAEGDWARSDRILESKRGLEKLGVFAEVKIEEIPVTAETENLVINLREGERYYVGAGVGLETKTEPQSFALWDNAIGPRGTAEFIMGNVLGRAAQLSLVSQFSLQEKRAVASWENRYLFGMPLQTTFNAWLEREALVSYGYDQRGVSLSGVKALGGDWVALTTLRWTSTTLYFLDVAENEVDRQQYPFSVTSISGSLIQDRRDDSFNPGRGTFFSAMAEWAYPLFQAESNFLKLFVKYQRYMPVFRTLTFSLTGRLGAAMGAIPIHERFFAGGSNTFRGEPFDRLGPKDSVSGMPVGGKAMLLFNFELSFPLFASAPALTGAVFYDKGNVFYSRKEVSLAQLEDAFGVGVRYRTPLGPLRIDFGWNVRPPTGRKQPIIFLTIGNVF
jgi:outer membrane protein assembly complex protein YaeT